MKADRGVCDCNVLISAPIMPLGKPRRCLDHFLDHGMLVLSPELSNALATRLARPKFARYIDDARRASFLQFLMGVADLVTISSSVRAARDPDDDMVLETALAGHADCLVTGDKDLLALRPIGEHAQATSQQDALWRSLVILRPAKFLTLVQSGGP